METSRLWARLKALAHLGQPSCGGRIQPRERFCAVIQLEQDRADRNRHRFSLVLFNTANPETNGTGAQYLAHVLVDRIRLTDEAGWFDSQRIGVLLPYTSMAGAQRLADDICQAVAAKASRLECEVYTYPSKSFPNGKGRSATFSPESKATTTPGLFAFDRHVDAANITSTAQRRLPSTTSNGGSLAQALEPVLRPLTIWQRAMDVVGASLALVVLSPILLLEALVIEIVSPGPVFFKQRRVGYMGKTFTMWKFRTMKPNADTSTHRQYLSRLINGASNGGSNDPMAKLDNDPQIIPFGQILRKTCVDELPQLINVLRGEMSLVGPRPAIPYEVEEYAQWHYRRFDVLPGMTGLWQVSGKNLLSFAKMMRLDIQYSREKSLWLDIVILLKTPLAIVSQIRSCFALEKKQRLIGEVVENA